MVRRSSPPIASRLQPNQGCGVTRTIRVSTMHRIGPPAQHGREHCSWLNACCDRSCNVSVTISLFRRRRCRAKPRPRVSLHSSWCSWVTAAQVRILRWSFSCVLRTHHICCRIAREAEVLETLYRFTAWRLGSIQSAKWRLPPLPPPLLVKHQPSTTKEAMSDTSSAQLRGIDLPYHCFIVVA